MQDNPSDRDRLRAAGRPITLADDRELALRFGLRELAELEEAFGSLDGFSRAINRPATAEGEPPPAWPIVTTTRQAMLIGLRRHGLTDADLDDLFDVARRWDYRDAVIAAYNEALGPPDPQGKGSAETSSSRGPTSTTPGPSDSAAPTPSSGE